MKTLTIKEIENIIIDCEYYNMYSSEELRGIYSFIEVLKNKNEEYNRFKEADNE